MGQKRNRESDWKILVLKTMQIPTEYNCNFICFIMPHYPLRPLMWRPGESASCLPCAVSFRGGPSPILSQPHVAHMRYAARSSFTRATERCCVESGAGYLGSMGISDVVRHQWYHHNVHPAQKKPYSGRISG